MASRAVAVLQAAFLNSHPIPVQPREATEAILLVDLADLAVNNHWLLAMASMFDRQWVEARTHRQSVRPVRKQDPYRRDSLCGDSRDHAFVRCRQSGDPPPYLPDTRLV